MHQGAVLGKTAGARRDLKHSQVKLGPRKEAYAASVLAGPIHGRVLRTRVDTWSTVFLIILLRDLHCQGCTPHVVAVKRKSFASVATAVHARRNISFEAEQFARYDLLCESIEPLITVTIEGDSAHNNLCDLLKSFRKLSLGHAVPNVVNP